MFNSLAILKLSRAWAKPHQIRRFAESATTANTRRKHLESGFVWVADKTQPVLTGKAILEHHEYLIAIKSTQENLMRARLGVTKQSKVLSNTLLRDLAEDRHDALKVAQNDLDRLVGIHMRGLLGQLEKLKGTDFWKFRGVYSPAMQDYVEAATFFFFCKNDVLLSLENLNESLRPQSNLVEPLKIGQHDYLVGLAGLSERLLTLADALIEQGKLDFTKRICVVVNRIFRELSCLTHSMDEMKMEIQSKLDTTIPHLATVERACFDTLVRGPRRHSAACFEFRERGSERSSAH